MGPKRIREIPKRIYGFFRGGGKLYLLGQSGADHVNMHIICSLKSRKLRPKWRYSRKYAYILLSEVLQTKVKVALIT